MEITEIKVMRGPNIWSGYRRQLIVMKLDLKEKEETPTNKIKGLAEALQNLMPTLLEHECSEGKPGGFLQRVREGTWLGHVVEHVALELQTLAGMDCGFGRTRNAKKEGVYNVVFAYIIENAGIYAGKAAVRLVEALSSLQPYDMAEDLHQLKRINRREGLGPSTLSIVREAEKRQIPYTRLNKDSLLMLGQGVNQRIIQSSVSATTSSIGVVIAKDKEMTRQVLSSGCIPVSDGMVVGYEDELEEAVEEIGFPLVVKPIDGNHGRGITTNITSYERAVAAFKLAKNVSEDVIVEKFITGMDFRMLVINFKLIAVAKRTPAMVTGDGVSSIKELIEVINTDPQRGDGHENSLTKIKVDKNTSDILEAKKLTLDLVLNNGEQLYLKDTANISSGGTASDVTDDMHPDNIFLAERIARLMNLDICGIDVIAPDISTPMTENGGVVLEVNAGPGFRMHLSPSNGKPRNVAGPLLDMLYPNGAPARIPLVAVTGTNGKTTVTRLIAYMAKMAGYNAGYTTTDGIYINSQTICYGDCSGPSSAAVVLRDPMVNFAVLECARGGILRSGLGFDKCNISIVTNVSADHLGLGDIDTLEELAKVKAVVPQNTADDGYAILNADDDLVYKMKEELDCNVALFSMFPDNERVLKHCEDGGLAAVIEDDYFVIWKWESKLPVMKVTDVTITQSGTIEYMKQNILPALLAAFISELPLNKIKSSLKIFNSSPEMTPGRMNIFRFKHFTLMVDYAHNEAGFIALEKYMSKVDAAVKTIVISATGDRRPQEIQNVGFYSARIFDEIIIKHDRDGRGRTNEELTGMIKEGILKVEKDVNVKVISNEAEAIHHVIATARENSFIVVCPDDVRNVLALIKEAQKKEEEDYSLMSDVMNQI